MRTQHQGHRGRRAAAAVAALLTVAAVALAVVATARQQDPASPSPLAAHPERERTGLPSASAGRSRGPSTGPATRPAVVGRLLAPSTPISLDIPLIGIHHARLVQLGLARDGSIQTPAPGPGSPAGWFRNSPTPGQLGPAVIVGHVDSATGGPAIFFRLGTLRPGDVATVTRADHAVAVFRVDSVERYAKTTFPALQVFGDTDHAALRLITCGGTFNIAKQSYEDNIVVYAHLASSHRA